MQVPWQSSSQAQSTHKTTNLLVSIASSEAPIEPGPSFRPSPLLSSRKISGAGLVAILVLALESFLFSWLFSFIFRSFVLSLWFVIILRRRVSLGLNSLQFVKSPSSDSFGLLGHCGLLFACLYDVV